MAFNSLLNKLHFFQSKDDAAKHIKACSEAVDGPVIVAFANAHAFNLAHKDNSFLADLLFSDVLLNDGVGVDILCRLNKIQGGENLNGTDFIPFYLSGYTQENTLSLYGTSDKALHDSIPKFEEMGPRVINSVNGFHDDDYYVEAFLQKPSDIVLLAMGMPKQERVARLLKSVNHKVVIICGGAIVDFTGGNVRRAPEWVRNLKSEWVFRLLSEPRRLFHRYIFGNLSFLYRAFIETK